MQKPVTRMVYYPILLTTYHYSTLIYTTERPDPYFFKIPRSIKALISCNACFFVFPTSFA